MKLSILRLRKSVTQADAGVVGDPSSFFFFVGLILTTFLV